MVGTTEDPTNSAKLYILLSSIPPKLRYLSMKQNWKLIKDEIRSLTYTYGLTHISDYDVDICYSQDGNMFAICKFKYNDDTREVFKVIRGHVLEGCPLQAWLFEPTENGPKYLDGPKDRVRGGILPHTPSASLNLSISRSRAFGGAFRPKTGQDGPPTHLTAVGRPRQDPNASKDRVLPQLRPSASVPTQHHFNNVDAVLAPQMSSYTTNLDPFEKRPGYFSPSVGAASEVSDLSRTLDNTPELSSLSRTSSVSAIPDAYLSARSPSYQTFQSTPGSPYANHNSSISSSSGPYTPSSSRNQSGSSHALRDTSSDEAYKVIFRNVKPGVTHKELSDLLDQNMPRYSYVQYERPKQGDANKWSVEFAREEDAERAKERLHNSIFKGWKLKVHLGNGASSRRRINSGGSTTSAASSSVAAGPTIVDGSVTSSH